MNEITSERTRVDPFRQVIRESHKHTFSKRFGIIHVDFATLERTLKASALAYSKVIESHGAVLSEPA